MATERDPPEFIEELVDVLAAMPGVMVVVLGGSRAIGSDDSKSDWDIGVYYRGSIELAALRAFGVVHPPGSWGRLMNGGAWLHCGGERVDVILRDLDTVEHWTRLAQCGEFEVDALLGYVAGIPTYTLTAELASCRPLRGEIPPVSYPSKLIAAAPARWRFCRSFSLEYARMHAARANRVGAIAHAARAVVEEAHAMLCERGQWVCNEKRLIESAALADVNDLFGHVPCDPSALDRWIDLVAGRLGVPTTDTTPWTDAAGAGGEAIRSGRLIEPHERGQPHPMDASVCDPSTP